MNFNHLRPKRKRARPTKEQTALYIVFEGGRLWGHGFGAENLVSLHDAPIWVPAEDEREE